MPAPAEKLWVGDSEVSRRFPLYTRGNAGEVFPNVVSPLTGSLFAESSVQAQTAMFRELGAIGRRDLEHGTAPFCGTFGGYLYLNLSLGRLLGVRAMGMGPEDVDTQMFGTSDAPPYRPQRGDRSPTASMRISINLFRQLRRPRFDVADDAQRDSAAWLRSLPDVASASDEELLALVPTFPVRLVGCFASLLTVTAASGGGRAIIDRMLRKKVGAATDDLINRMTGGLGTIDSSLLARRLWTIGRIVRDDAALTAAFDAGTNDVLDRIRTSRTEAAQQFVEAFDGFLAEHGHRGSDEYELSLPNWRMEPRMVVAAIDRLRLAPAERSPDLAQTRLAADRHEAVAEAERLIPRPLRGFFRHCLRSATVGSEARERAKDAFVLELSGMRMVLHELVRRARERGGPDDPRDGFLVTAEELPRFVADPSAFHSVIAERRARRDELQARVPPFWFDGRMPDPSTWPLRAPSTTVATSPQRLHGIGVCPGVASGPARVITDPGDPGALGPGDVLIAPFTDPSWTPLFLAASAVVVDVGAQQSHAAIVARELGIPAVVSVTGATRTIADGSWVTVDGATGEVTVEPRRES